MKKITLLASLFVAFTMNSQLIIEGFDDITTLVDYTVVNVSDAPDSDIFQGNDTVFISHSGADDSYLGMNFNATSGSIIDLYLILPLLELENGDELTFYTRTVTASSFPDRLEVRLDPDGSGVLPTFGDFGSYTELLLEINPTLTVGGYPEDWELQTVIVSGLTGPTTTSLTFRYWVTDGGPAGANSNYIGIDTMEVIEILSVEDQSFNDFNYFVDVNNQLNLRANAPFESVQLFNVAGQQVVSQKLANTNEVVDLASLTTGVYFATVAIDGNTKSFKIIKK